MRCLEWESKGGRGVKHRSSTGASRSPPAPWEGKAGEEGGRKSPWMRSVHQEPQRGGKGKWPESTNTQATVHQPHGAPQPAVHHTCAPHPGRWAEPSARPKPKSTRPAADRQPPPGRPGPSRQGPATSFPPLAAELGQFEPKPLNQLLFLFLFFLHNYNVHKSFKSPNDFQKI